MISRKIYLLFMNVTVLSPKQLFSHFTTRHPWHQGFKSKKLYCKSGARLKMLNIVYSM